MGEAKPVDVGHSRLKKNINTLLMYTEWVGLAVVVLATIVAFLQHIFHMLQVQKVALHDLLLFFIYIEIITMVGLYFNTGKLPIRYPIYIAIVAIARYIVIGMENLTSVDVIGLCAGVLVLTLAALAIRFGHVKMPYLSE